MLCEEILSRFILIPNTFFPFFLPSSSLVSSFHLALAIKGWKKMTKLITTPERQLSETLFISVQLLNSAFRNFKCSTVRLERIQSAFLIHFYRSLLDCTCVHF